MNSPSYVFDLDLAARVSAQRDLLRRLKWFRWMQRAYLAFPILFVALGLLAGQSLGSVLLRNLPWIIGLPLFGFVVLPWLNRWGLSRQLRGNPALNGTQTVTFNPEGLHIDNPASSSDIRWGALTHIVESRDNLLFYYSYQCAYFLPLTAVPSADRDRVRVYIKQHFSGQAEFLSGDQAPVAQS
jgi:hypothetical protein